MVERLIVVAVALVACSGDEIPPLPSTIESATAPCRAHCERTSTCYDPTTDVDACTMTCAMAAEGWERQDALATIYACEKALGCDDTAAEKACGGTVQPLPIHLMWEDACRVQLRGCLGPGDFDAFCAVQPPMPNQSQDVGAVRLIAEPVIEEMIACLDAADCGARLTCLDMVYDAHHIKL